jgi:hypothetical protein
MPFNCSICEEESTRICVQCTKDTCSNHLCDKCGCCSDCCDCEVPLDDVLHADTVHPAPEPVPVHAAEPPRAPLEEPAAAAAAEGQPLVAGPEPAAIVEPVAGIPPTPDPRPEPPHPPPDPDPFPGKEPEPEPPGPVLSE